MYRRFPTRADHFFSLVLPFKKQTIFVFFWTKCTVQSTMHLTDQSKTINSPSMLHDQVRSILLTMKICPEFNWRKLNKQEKLSFPTKSVCSCHLPVVTWTGSNHWLTKDATTKWGHGHAPHEFVLLVTILTASINTPSPITHQGLEGRWC